MLTSCSTPFSTRATRVSRGVTLISISCATRVLPVPLVGNVEFLEQLRCLEQRQSHHAGITAFQSLDEHGRPPLDGVSPGLVPGLAGMPVAHGLLATELAKRHMADRQPGR